MEVRIRSWCCKLDTFVVTVAIIQTLLYFVLALGVILWYLLQNLRRNDDVYESIVEVSNFSDIFPHPDHTNVIVLITGLIISFLGILTSLFLIVGVKTRQRSLLLPWLILHLCLIVLIFVAGLYLIVHYTILIEEKDYLKAALSLFLIVLGILFIFLWILVDQVFIRQKLEKSLVPKSSARWASSQSVTPHVMPWYPDTGTVKSIKSVASVHSARSLRSVAQQREAHKNYKNHDFSVNATLSRLANQKRLSRSLDHILENSSSDSSNSRDSRAHIKDFKSLPRPRNKKTKKSGGSIGFHDRSRNNDTIRSCKSLASAKSVTIDPQVREYRYQNSRSSESMDKVDLEDPISFLQGVPPPFHQSLQGVPQAFHPSPISFNQHTNEVPPSQNGDRHTFHKPQDDARQFFHKPQDVVTQLPFHKSQDGAHQPFHYQQGDAPQSSREGVPHTFHHPHEGDRQTTHQPHDGVRKPFHRSLEDFSDEGVTEFRSSPETSDRVQKRGYSVQRLHSVTGCDISEGRVRISIPSPVYPRESVSRASPYPRESVYSAGSAPRESVYPRKSVSPRESATTGESVYFRNSAPRESVSPGKSVYPRESVSPGESVYPREHFLTMPRGFTRDQIINTYCDGDVAL